MPWLATIDSTLARSSDPAAGIELRLLGPLEVQRDGELLPDLGRRERALLELLALRAGETVPRDRLVDELWGEQPPASAANALQVYVSHLRKALGRDLVAMRGGGYVLALDTGQVDALRFESLASAGRRHLERREHAAAARVLAEALGLWRGPALADAVDTPSLAAESARLHGIRLEAEQDRIDAELALGRHSEVVPTVASLVAEHPLDERLRAQLMLALYRSGRQADALAAYRDARETLVEELGIEPGAALRELEQAILRQDAELDLPRLDAPRRLPPPPSPLVGRRSELEQGLSTLRGGARLVTLTGPGGIGKTRLGLELGHLLADEFAGGAVFVGLDSVGDAGRFEATVAAAAGVEPERPLAPQLADASLLLLLDNLEHLPEASPRIAELLGAAPELCVIATSRSPLRLAAEQVLPIPPMEPDDAAELFVGRARSALPSFAPEEFEDAIDGICERLEGLPLALELAAVRVPLLSPPELLERLTSRLSALGSGPLDAPTRQQTIRGAIDWSCELLSFDERRLFAQLAVFAGGATIEAAASVAGEDVLDRIEALLRQSLVQTRSERRTRIRMLEVVREHALEQLEASGEEEAVRVRHLAYFARFVGEAEPGLYGAEQQSWFERLEAEHDNVRAALRFALDTGRGDEALELAARMVHFWIVRGHLAEACDWLERSLAAEVASPAVVRSKAWNGVGIARGELDDLDASAAAFELSLELARETGDDERTAIALGNLGNVWLLRGDYVQTRRLCEEAVAIYRRLGDDIRLSTNLENLACTALCENEVETALALAREAVEAAIRAGDTRSQAWRRRVLALALIRSGEAEAAASELATSLELGEAIGDRHGLLQSVEVVAALATATDDAPTAAALVGATGRRRAEIGMPRPRDETLLLEGSEREMAERLGPAALDRELTRGRDLQFDDAVALARDVAERAAA
ncbi:MAG TPA: BTAD domain-containing putative transcriptional regulator [Gaiellaceae bacterium]